MINEATQVAYWQEQRLNGLIEYSTRVSRKRSSQKLNNVEKLNGYTDGPTDRHSGF